MAGLTFLSPSARFFEVFKPLEVGKDMTSSKGNIELANGSRIGVVGGGPAGSFFSFYALEYARRFDLDIHLDIFEPKDFTKVGAGGCNHCGGIVSESLVQHLATDGIVIPSKIIQRGINTYTMHTEQGIRMIHSPSNEHRIASVFRGCGPRGCLDVNQRGFDNYLLGLCREKGADVIHKKVISLEREGDQIRVSTSKSESKTYDLVVGAVGLNKKGLELFGSVCPSYTLPVVTRTYISEFFMKPEDIKANFGNSMHVFLLDIPHITFGALIPKENYVTLVLLGKNIDKKVVERFITAEEVRSCFPEDFPMDRAMTCTCYPYVNIKQGNHPFDDRVVLIGDSGSSKLYKNGIGAAFLTGKAAASTAIFEGVGEADFKSYYEPICKDLDRDNQVGKLIFWVTRLIQKSPLLKKGLLDRLSREQSESESSRNLSSALWDTFTGSEGYRNILKRFLSPRLLMGLAWSLIYSNTPFSKGKVYKKQKAGLGRFYEDGEMIIKQGTKGNCLYVIQRGRVEIIKETSEGDVKVAELGESEFFGEMGLFEEDVRSCTVRAIGDTQVLTVDKRNLYKSIHQDSSLAYRLLETMSNRLREANKMIRNQ